MKGLIRKAILVVGLTLPAMPQTALAANHFVSVAPVETSQHESGGPYAFTVAISPALEDTEQIVVSYQTGDGSVSPATAGSDYTAASGTLTFTSASSAPQTVTVPILDDAIKESDETFELQITAAVPSGTDLSSNPAAVGALPAPALGTITDDDYVITLATADLTIKENETETLTWVQNYTVTIDRAPGTDTVTVGYATANGTAVAGSDFTAASGTLAFTGSTTTQTIPVTILNDALVEGSENFSLNLSSPSGNATIADNTVVTTITDNDHTITISPDFHVHEGTGPATFQAIVVPALAVGETVTVIYATANGTATAPADFTATSGSLTFSNVNNPISINVPIINDATSEGAETFSMNLTGPSANATITDAQSIATIDDNDDYKLSITNSTVNEDAGTATFTVSIDKHPPAGDVITVDYATVAGTATAGSDFTATSGTLTFNNASLDNQNITVTILDDAVKEVLETYQVRLSNPSANAAFSGTGIGAGGITDDDYAVITFNNVSVSENVAGGNATLSVVLDRNVATGDSVTFSVSTTPGTALGGGTDYGAASTPITIPAGSNTGTITVPITNDAIIEHNETFDVSITGTSGNVLVTTGTTPDNTATVTINDDNKYSVVISNAPNVTEGDSPGSDAIFTVTVTPAVAAGDSVSLNWYTTNGSAVSPADYTAASGNISSGTDLTFAPGESSKTITIITKEDTLDEGDEYFYTRLSINSSNPNYDLVTIADNSGYCYILDDEYTITPTWNLHGTVTLQSPPGTDVPITNGVAQKINNNEVAVFTATADYGFTSWSTSTPGTVTETVISPTERTYTFSAATPPAGQTLNILFDHKIDYTATGNGTVTPTAPVAGPPAHASGPLSYITDHNSTPVFAIAADGGQCTTDLKIDGVSQGAFKTGEDNWSSESYTFPAVTDNHTLEAIFNTATVTVYLGADDGATGTDEDHYIQTNANTGWRAYKTDASYTVSSANLIKTGKHGDSFSIPGDTGGSCDERYFVIQYFDLDGWLKPADTKLDLQNAFKNQTVQGLYDANSHQLTIIADPAKGSVTVDPVGDPGGDNIYIYSADTSVKVQAIANTADGWLFQGWQQDASGSTNPLTITMDKDKTIEAIFARPCNDDDKDGYVVAGGTSCVAAAPFDCNDGDPNINPGAAEICGNGIDEDCSGMTNDVCSGPDADGDSDGFTGAQGDCNDGNNAIYPGATEIPGNNVDEDCFDGDKEIGVEETCVTPSDVPANAAKKPAPPLIMFLVDDSGSMDWEFMTSENQQLYENEYYVYAYHQNSRAYSDYKLDDGQRREWLSQWSGYNRMFFNPATQYDPWPKWDEVVNGIAETGSRKIHIRTSAAAPQNGIEKRYDTNNATFPDIAFKDDFVHADMDNPRTNTVDSAKGYPMVYVDSDGITQTMDLNGEFFRIKVLGQQVKVERDASSTGGDTRADAIGLSTRNDLQVNQTNPPTYRSNISYPTGYELFPWATGYGLAGGRPDAPELIFDDADADVFAISANWDPSAGDSYWEWGENSALGKVGQLYYTDNTNTWATWRMNVPAGKEGDYYVYAWIDDWADTDSNAKYTITYYDTATSSYVSETLRADQRPNPNGGAAEGPRWIRLANKTYHFKEQTGATSDIIVPNAHYFTWHDKNGDEVRDNGEVYLVTIPGTGRTVGSYTLNYYRFDDISGDEQIDDGELVTLVPGVDDAEIATIKPVRFDENGDPITDSAQLAYVVRQNFADWFSFYRRRILTSKAAVGLTTYDMERVSLGIYSIHQRVHEPLVYMELADGPKKLAYLKSVYGDPASDGTPLRRALNEVGRYFLEGDTKDSIDDASVLKTSEGLTSASDATRPSVFWDANSDVDADTIDDSGGECQRAFVIAMTDGYYNESFSYTNQDTKALGSPYALRDSAGSGVSDVAVTYYRRDLDTVLANELEDKGFDDASHQHLVTFGVSFGVFGQFDPNMYPDCLPSCTTPGEDGCPNLADLGKIIPGTQYQKCVEDSGGNVTCTDTSNTGPWAGACPNWHSTNTTDSPKAIDDLFHASVNGRGEFLNASDPAELVASLKKIKDLIEENQGTAASVSINANKIEANTLLFQTSYDSGDWSGNVEAKCLDALGNIASCQAVSCESSCNTAYESCSSLCDIGDAACEEVCITARTTCYTTNNCTSFKTCSAAHTECVNGCSGNAACIDICDDNKATCSENPPEIKWSASDELDTVGWQDREILTANPAGSGLPFRWGDTNDASPDGLTAAMKATLGGQQRLLEYLRGDASCEAGNTTGCVLNYRARSSKLGDFINSEPYYQKISALGIDWVFSGANDGMLHVFNGSTGDELFAFVPFTVFDNLDELADPGYNDIHKFFVDGYVTAQDLGDATILVGGLGKGGKGLYALNLDAAATAVAANDVEGSAQAIVKWEYNALTQAANAAIVANLGYSYSRPQIVKSNDPSAAWLLVFGNGYNSPSGHAVLFLVGLDTSGNIVWTHMIDTGVGDPLPANNNCNGLSTPALILPQGDGTNDFIFAGDLLGNMWKFDISDANRANWGVYFKNGAVNKPLFEARSNAGWRQPITMKPDVTTSCVNGTEGYLVAFGTGRLLDPEVDNLDQSIQTMYGVWDWSAEWALVGKDPHAMYLGYFMPKTSTVTAACNATCDAELGTTSTADTCLYNCLGNSECELECIETAESCTNNCNSVRNLSNMAAILGDTGSARYVALLEQRQVSVLGLKYNSDGSIKEQIYGETNLKAVDEVVRTVSDNEMNWLLPMENDGVLEPDELDLYISDTSKKISHVGWYFDLPENGERAVKDVRIASGKLIFTTNTPSSSPCVGGGTSQIWAVEACSGGRSKHAYFDLNGDGVIDERDYINIGTKANPIWIAPSSVKLEGIVPSPTLVEVQRSLDRLFFPDSREDSGIGSLGTSGYGLPIRYWRELDWQ